MASGLMWPGSDTGQGAAQQNTVCGGVWGAVATSPLVYKRKSCCKEPSRPLWLSSPSTLPRDGTLDMEESVQGCTAAISRDSRELPSMHQARLPETSTCQAEVTLSRTQHLEKPRVHS